MNKKFFINMFLAIPMFGFMCLGSGVKAEDIPANPNSPSIIQEGNNSSAESQKIVPNETVRTEPQVPPSNESEATHSESPPAKKDEEKIKKENKKKSKKSSQSVDKPKKDSEKTENKNEEFQKNVNQIVQSQITLPDISDSRIEENDITIPPKSKNSEEKLIKGVISWIMIISGTAIIICVIINNRKIPNKSAKHLSLRKLGKSHQKKHLYYKKSRRK